jgi:uncharacterized protein YkwD
MVKIPSLQFNPRIYIAAKSHIYDMIENAYYDSVSLDGRTSEDRILDNVYNDTFNLTGEISDISFCDVTHLSIFEEMFINEITGNPSDRKLLNPEFSDAGLGFIKTKSGKIQGLCSDEMNILLVDFGAFVEF